MSVDIDKIRDVDISKKIVKVKTDDDGRIDDIKSLLTETYSWTVEVNKQFVARHQEQIKISSPLEMVSQYIRLTGKYDNGDALIEKAREILQ